MQGRMHHYEGYSYEEVSYAVRVLRLLGCDTLIVTNAAGCVRTDWQAGDLMLITDQIKLFSESPLRGENLPQFGTRFPDMSKMYTPALQDIARASAKMKPWLLLLVIIPFWTNSLIRTYALILILKANGLISTLLVWLGVTEQPVSFMYGDFAVFMGILYTFLPFMVLPLYASIEKLDSRLLDAARDLGASGFQSFWHVTFPLTLPGIIAGSMLVFLPSLGAFYIPEILGGAKSMLIGNFIKNQFMVARDWPLGAAASTILTLLLALLIAVYRMANRKVASRDRMDEVA